MYILCNYEQQLCLRLLTWKLTFKCPGGLWLVWTHGPEYKWIEEVVYVGVWMATQSGLSEPKQGQRAPTEEGSSGDRRLVRQRED